MRDYRKIEAWRRADDLTVSVYNCTRAFPREELYGLTSQLRRAASSAPANIVEGSSRESLRDYLHYLIIARGSLSEAQYFIHLACRLGYLKEDDFHQLAEAFRQAFACLHGLIKAVGRECGKPGRTPAPAAALNLRAPAGVSSQFNPSSSCPVVP